jgi:hypothetical protein
MTGRALYKTLIALPDAIFLKERTKSAKGEKLAFAGEEAGASFRRLRDLRGEQN